MENKTSSTLAPLVCRRTYDNGEPVETVLSSGARIIAIMAQGDIEDEERDGALIVRAVNAHDELVAAAQNARNVLAALVTGELKEIKADSPALAMLRAALAKAEGK